MRIPLKILSAFCNIPKTRNYFLLSRGIRYCGTMAKNLDSHVGCFKEVTDRYHGVSVDTCKFSLSDAEFEGNLESTLTHWCKTGIRGVWFKVDTSNASYVPILVKNGFTFHHAKKAYVMLTKWLVQGVPDLLPQFPHTHIGVGGMVINENNQVLAIQEKYGFKHFWKLPGGYSNPGEDFADTAKREVFEETGIQTEFVSVISLRHQHVHLFDCSDIYVVCHMRPISNEITKGLDEVEECQWMDVKTYCDHPQVSEFNKFVMAAFLENQRKNMAIVSTNVPSVRAGFYPCTYTVKSLEENAS